MDRSLYQLLASTLATSGVWDAVKKKHVRYGHAQYMATLTDRQRLDQTGKQSKMQTRRRDKEPNSQANIYQVTSRRTLRALLIRSRLTQVDNLQHSAFTKNQLSAGRQCLNVKLNSYFESSIYQWCKPITYYPAEGMIF